MQGEYILRKGTNRLLDHPAFPMQQCKCVDIHRSGQRMVYTFFQYIFTLHEPAFLCCQTKQQFNTTAVWEMLTIHESVVAWQLLEAVCPVLLTRGGIPRKGLTAQWLSTVCQFVQR